MKSGLYALASLDGAPILPADREVLGLAASPPQLGDGKHDYPDISVRICDTPHAAGAESAVHLHTTADEVLAFAGYLDEPDDLAVRLGVETGLPTPKLALLALDRFGAAAPWHMVGEWSLLRWNIRARELTLLGSENTRDPIFWATNGSLVAVASDAMRLGRLPWVGLSLDSQGFALSLSRAGLRRIRTRQTVWRGISLLPPGTREIFNAAGRAIVESTPEPEPVPFSGGLEEAVETLNALGRRIIGQNMRRYSRSAFLLSGGLDSTLLAALGAQERDAAENMFCLTSVAPHDSGLADERDFSRAAAQQLGLSLFQVSPERDASVYRPCSQEFAFAGGPIVSSRHFLYRALQQEAAARGAHALFDGVMGEMTITEKRDTAQNLDWLRRVVHAIRRWHFQRVRGSRWPVQGFHARLSPQLLGALPAEWRRPWREGMPQRTRLSPHELRGIHPALAKSAAVETATAEGPRRLFPFRDRRLVRFAAGLPYGFGEHGGEDRAMARAMLRERVPEYVRLRRRGMPFSPDYVLRMNEQAAQARQRIHAFQDVGVGRWLDLDWLAGALDRLSSGADPYAAEQVQAQTTVMAGEFLLWCREQQINI